jgi:hypothetical protein
MLCFGIFTICIEPDIIGQNCYFFLKYKILSVREAGSNSDKLIRQKIKTNICRGESSNLFINHRELKLGAYSHWQKRCKS